LETVDFCGTYGDAIAAANIIELVTISKRHSKKIIIRTNGSLRTTKWWKSFAELLKDIDHEVWFCLDGLADTHSIYRQATDFDTIITNAQAFMSNGGIAVWQFIPWAHNEHQIKDCIRTSQQLGFKRFEFIRGVRRNFTARNYQSGTVIPIEPWSQNTTFSKYEKISTKVEVSSCCHLTQPSLYINASGKISNCCYINKTAWFNTVEELPDIKKELQTTPRHQCLYYCGT
jgi:sulfatase maturation enzyme AslB (radical SAM superfamily)